jgi:hypothetical protein
LRSAHPRHAAEQFIGLVRGDLQLKALLALGEEASEMQQDEIIRSGVETFYLAYHPTMSVERAFA